MKESDSTEDIREIFERLAEQWREETCLISSLTDICYHPAYLQIIGLGPAAVPVILQDMASAKSGGGWLWGTALASITRQNPAAGTEFPDQASEAWLEWGRQQGYDLGIVE